MDGVANLSGLQMGLAMGIASIISVGPNNLMLLREGLTRGRSGFVVLLVCASYVVLVIAAIMLASAVLAVDQGWQELLCYAGCGALLWFAILAFRAAFTRIDTAAFGNVRESPHQCLMRVLKVVWLNPLTYVELLLIPAAIAKSLDGEADRIAFAATLLFMSALCTLAYAYGGTLLARLVRNHARLRLFDFASGIILSGLSVSLIARLMIETT